jgi:hypothetical protein
MRRRMGAPMIPFEIAILPLIAIFLAAANCRFGDRSIPQKMFKIIFSAPDAGAGIIRFSGG